MLAVHGFGSALAADFDGSKGLLCANVQAVECVAGAAACIRATPFDLGVPTFIRLDFEGQRIVGPYRSTPVRLMEKNTGQILLQGSELDFGWTVALNTVTGEVSSMLMDREVVIALFGYCTVP
jgi:hypothetical protein